MSIHPPLLEICGLTRRIGSVVVLEDVNLTLVRGEIVGLMGASGAGKTALVHWIAGMARGSAEPRHGAKNHPPHTPTNEPAATPAATVGRLLWHGRDVTRMTPSQATALGIALVPQEPALPDTFTVAEAISLGREPVRFGWFLDRPAMTRRAHDWLGRLGVAFDPTARLDALSASQRQMVALARALAAEPSLLLLDEPTGPLRPQDTDRLFEILGDLQARGTCIVYVSDRLGEIEALATRVVVLRDGRISGTLDRLELSRESLSALIVGKDLDLPIKELIEPGLEVLRVENVRTARHPKRDLSFTVREGEVVGLAGLVGCGRSELLRAIFGLDRAFGGSVVVNEAPLRPGTPAAAIAAGVALVAADGAIDEAGAGLALRDAIALPSLRRLSPAGLVNDQAIDRLAVLMNDHVSITPGPLDQPIGQLTTGQRRKAAIAQWLALKPSLVLLDEPTRGVAMSVRPEIYEMMERFAERGAAVLFASNDMDELLRVADRVLVMRDGGLAGCLTRDDDFSERGIMRLAAELPT